MTLPDLTAYMKLPEDYPIAKVSFTYQDLPSKNFAFLSKPEKQKEAVLPEEDEDLDQGNTNENTQNNFEKKEEYAV